MTTLAECKKAIADKPRHKLAAGREELIAKIDAQRRALMAWVPQEGERQPAFITFYTSLGTYKVLNTIARLDAFRLCVIRSSGWTGKHREHADDLRTEWKRNGLRATRVDKSNGFAEAVRETADAEKDIEAELNNANWRMTQHREREERLKRETLSAANEWKKARCEVAALTLKHQAAMLASASARGEFAEFQAYIEGRKANHEQPE